MKKTAETQVPVLAAIAERWSPRAYDSSYQLNNDELVAILEAGRWAPSAMNVQPWRFSVVRRDEALAETLTKEALFGFNAAWVPNASLVIYISVPETTEDGSPYTIAYFDAGLAAQNMMLQAEALGLSAHPISGFSSENASKILELEEGRTAIVALAVGKRAEPEVLQGSPAYDREIADRHRLPLTEVVIRGL